MRKASLAIFQPPHPTPPSYTLPRITRTQYVAYQHAQLGRDGHVSPLEIAIMAKIHHYLSTQRLCPPPSFQDPKVLPEHRSLVDKQSYAYLQWLGYKISQTITAGVSMPMEEGLPALHCGDILLATHWREQVRQYPHLKLPDGSRSDVLHLHLYATLCIVQILSQRHGDPSIPVMAPYGLGPNAYQGVIRYFRQHGFVVSEHPHRSGLYFD